MGHPQCIMPRTHNLDTQPLPHTPRKSEALMLPPSTPPHIPFDQNRVILTASVSPPLVAPKHPGILRNRRICSSDPCSSEADSTNSGAEPKVCDVIGALTVLHTADRPNLYPLPAPQTTTQKHLCIKSYNLHNKELGIISRGGFRKLIEWA